MLAPALHTSYTLTMFSKLPPEIVRYILDMYSKTVGRGYLALRLVNKQICAHVTGTTRSYVRNHCAVNDIVYDVSYDGFVTFLHKKLVNKIIWNAAVNIQFTHAYLPISIVITDVHSRPSKHVSFIIAKCRINVGKLADLLNIRCSNHDTGYVILFTRHYSFNPMCIRVENFIEEYFTELHNYIVGSKDRAILS
jgi:hypothetical protein